MVALTKTSDSKELQHFLGVLIPRVAFAPSPGGTPRRGGRRGR